MKYLIALLLVTTPALAQQAPAMPQQNSEDVWRQIVMFLAQDSGRLSQENSALKQQLQMLQKQLADQQAAPPGR